MWRASLADARREGRRPIIVGGTGLYFKALVEGLSPIPPIPDEVRAHWRAEAADKGAAHVHGVLTARDPEMAQRLAPGDTQRIVRALEVLDATGMSLADWQRMPRAAGAGLGRRPFRSSSRSSAKSCRGASTARFLTMMERGALDEVLQLKALDLDPSLPLMTALGVRPLLAISPASCRAMRRLLPAKRRRANTRNGRSHGQRGNMIAWNAH